MKNYILAILGFCFLSSIDSHAFVQEFGWSTCRERTTCPDGSVIRCDATADYQVICDFRPQEWVSCKAIGSEGIDLRQFACKRHENTNHED
jgi:hypothetical protein